MIKASQACLPCKEGNKTNVMMFFIVPAFMGRGAVWVAGGLSMARDGKFDTLHAEEFMEGRIIMQLITLGLIVIAALAWA